MSSNQAYRDTYQGEPAVWLKFGRYEAVLLPEVGGNLIAFRDTENGYAFLHEPTAEEMPAFKARPFIHGIPVLFPPNRFEDGKFPWNGRTLEFPVNEPATGNHLHGFVHSETFEVEDFGATATESYVVAALKVDERSEVYKYLPFRFTLRLRYAIGENGLEQQFTVVNDGEETMPCLFAFHTSVNAPFVPGSSAKDYRLKLTIGERWHMSERMLPTGEFQPLSPNEEAMKGEGVYPFFESLDNHYTAVPQNGRNRMELTDTKAGLTLVYDAGTSYKEWMIWNNGATEGFFCPEPQVSLVNAPNTDKPADEIGLFSLAPGEIWQERARIYVK
ncbi:aldose 1-epimerase [Paenibacillus sp. MWE-103]|uniref:Aldose 1-epimerase n=1 Tax=Paenibacillus artemisiicola TaxID=1172618 RepID=A0ABS3W7K2_9BACL|nr:aldose 1-epimerase [Paenibacillus artemisiicola]MBO7744294.1 aldose 1-epimerase [Paenibacillus artemisiicola]